EGQGQWATVDDGSEGKERIDFEAALIEDTETPSGVESATEHERGRQLSETTHLTSETEISTKVPEKELNQGRKKASSEYAAPEVLDLAVVHTPTGHTLRASVCVDGKAIPGPPDPIVMPSAVLCGPSRGDSDGAVWRGTGARPKDRRTMPPDQSVSIPGSRCIALRSGTTLLAPLVARPRTAEIEPDPKAAEASETEMAHIPTGPAFGASAFRVRRAPYDSPVPPVRTAAVVRGPADGNSIGSAWRSLGGKAKKSTDSTV
ncbi:hypothetical protein MTO96_034313, partial [Rhipicephalus appendiculatus]